MKSSLCILGFFVAGIVAGLIGIIPVAWKESAMELYALYVLLVFVGIGIGSDSQALKNFFRLSFKSIMVPVGVIAGSLGGAALASLVLAGVTLQESMGVGAGLGYYSLSSVIISQLHGDQLGVVALLANIFREVLTLVMAPFLVRYCGPLAPIAAGGATTMDTTLPVISKLTPKEYSMIAVINGIILTAMVPLLVPFFF